MTNCNREEEWREVCDKHGRPIVSTSGLAYLVSDAGQVKSVGRKGRERVLRPRIFKGGRRIVCVRSGHQPLYLSIGQLVCRAFFGNPPRGLAVVHIDGDRGNDAIENLRYGTFSEATATDKPASRVKVVCLETGTEFPSLKTAARMCGLSVGTVWTSARSFGRLSAGKGMHFVRSEDLESD